MNMKRILSSCLLGVLLTSSLLAERASAQVEVIFGNDHRQEWREREHERLALIRREREERERREWRRREHERREWRERHQYDYR
ncbi:MAG: hypothetical protein V7K14_15420 [Nostoc sp.]|uniref:hypothetical protein n=1 Tax=unclassified Nostoc TaxID=2593658 RepID=UPI0025F08F79|nr:hypothetical protein [Nostoc sp. NMS7]MBN3945773.1 hypothetical protein [Nostoc sp. NMS7]